MSCRARFVQSGLLLLVNGDAAAVDGLRVTRAQITVFGEGTIASQLAEGERDPLPPRLDGKAAGPGATTDDLSGPAETLPHPDDEYAAVGGIGPDAGKARRGGRIMGRRAATLKCGRRALRGGRQPENSKRRPPGAARGDSAMTGEAAYDGCASAVFHFSRSRFSSMNARSSSAIDRRRSHCSG